MINCHAQNMDNSFVHSNPLSQFCGNVVDICGTYDNGFVYAYYVPEYVMEPIDSMKTKFLLHNISWVKPASYVKKDNISNYQLIKVSSGNEILWWKYFEYEEVSEELRPYHKKVLIETKNRSLLFSYSNYIALHDSVGNKLWEINFNTDSVPGIERTLFYKNMIISDIKECSDGGFIALLDNSFSLLKISSEGKLIWLKSTLFKNFDDFVIDYYDSKYLEVDTLGINSLIWKRGGGEYVFTSNIIETEDGYLALGKAKYRAKDLQDIYDAKNKTSNAFYQNHKFKVKIDNSQKEVFPKRIIFQAHSKVKGFDTKFQGSTVLVKTDKQGNVIWEKYFGDYNWEDHLYYSNLIKLNDSKCLVHVHDRLKEENGDFSVPVANYYLIDGNGNILEKPKIVDKEIKDFYISFEPEKILPSKDNGFYLFKQGAIAKADSTFELLWYQFFGSWAQDIKEYAVLTNNGVVACERGVFYKYDKYGNEPSDSVSIDVEVINVNYQIFNKPSNQRYRLEDLSVKDFKYPSVHFKINHYNKDVGILRVEPVDIKTNKKFEKQFVAYSIFYSPSQDNVRLNNKANEFYQKNKKISKRHWENPYFLNLAGFNPGIYQFAIQKNTFDLGDIKQINGWNLTPMDYQLFPYAFEIENLYGFKNIYTFFLWAGEYNYKIINKKSGEIVKSGNFMYKD